MGIQVQKGGDIQIWAGSFTTGHSHFSHSFKCYSNSQSSLIFFLCSFWNFLDLTSYVVAMIIPPCVLLRYGLHDGGFVYALVSGPIITEASVILSLCTWIHKWWWPGAGGSDDAFQRINNNKRLGGRRKGRGETGVELKPSSLSWGLVTHPSMTLSLHFNSFSWYLPTTSTQPPLNLHSGCHRGHLAVGESHVFWDGNWWSWYIHIVSLSRCLYFYMSWF